MGGESEIRWPGDRPWSKANRGPVGSRGGWRQPPPSAEIARPERTAPINGKKTCPCTGHPSRHLLRLVSRLTGPPRRRMSWSGGASGRVRHGRDSAQVGRYGRSTGGLRVLVCAQRLGGPNSSAFTRPTSHCPLNGPTQDNFSSGRAIHGAAAKARSSSEQRHASLIEPLLCDFRGSWSRGHTQRPKPQCPMHGLAGYARRCDAGLARGGSCTRCTS